MKRRTKKQLHQLRFDLVRQGLVVIAFVSMLVVNTLAELLPFNNLTVADISGQFRVYFMPANYAFFIWTLIYIGLTGYVVYQASPKQRANPTLQATGYWFILSCALNAVWIITWHYLLFDLAIWVIMALFISLLILYFRSRAYWEEHTKVHCWLVQLPFSLYLSWITVASLLNLSVQLVYKHPRVMFLSSEYWASSLIIIATIVALCFVLSWRDIAFGMVIIWALIGIAVKFSMNTNFVQIVLLMVGVIALAISYVVIAKAIQQMQVRFQFGTLQKP